MKGEVNNIESAKISTCQTSAIPYRFIDQATKGLVIIHIEPNKLPTQYQLAHSNMGLVVESHEALPLLGGGRAIQLLSVFVDIIHT